MRSTPFGDSRGPGLAAGDDEPAVPARRWLLRGALSVGATMMVGGCSAPSPGASSPEAAQRPVTPPATGKAVLLAWFSRAGENYHYGGRRDLKVGNTEILTRLISRRIGCDVHRIEPVDPYPHDYEETVERNVREQDAGARPAIAGSLPSIDRYDTVLLASPIWNVRAPMIMQTFTERLGFRGKTVLPVTTYAMSGLGTTERDYAASCPGATIGQGLAVRGEEVTDAQSAVDAWLRRVRLL